MNKVVLGLFVGCVVAGLVYSVSGSMFALWVCAALFVAGVLGL